MKIWIYSPRLGIKENLTCLVLIWLTVCKWWLTNAHQSGFAVDLGGERGLYLKRHMRKQDLDVALLTDGKYFCVKSESNWANKYRL
jgi:hypothetical protein